MGLKAKFLTSISNVAGVISDVGARHLLGEGSLLLQLADESLHDVRGTRDGARLGAVVARHLDLGWADCLDLGEEGNLKG